jgi:hypothetical protein
MKIPGGQGPLAVVDQHCVSVEKLVFWIILTIAVLVIFIGRAKMKVRFSLVLVSLSGQFKKISLFVANMLKNYDIINN